MTQVFRSGEDFVVLKGKSVRLAEDNSLSACFDPMALSYRCIWQDGFVQFHPFRWGTSRNASPAGDNIWFTEPAFRAAVVRIRKRYRNLLREQVADTVISENQVESELTELMQALRAA